MTATDASHKLAGDLLAFLQSWDATMAAEAAKIPIFRPELVKSWSAAQRQTFVQLLYHQRAHFHDVLWLMASSAPDSESREVILANIHEEVGKFGRSHESLYQDFAQDHGIDLSVEFVEEEFYEPFLRDYNRGHLRWLVAAPWLKRLVGFAVIERLDNVDYKSLLETARAMGTSPEALKFFKVHVAVQHFDAVGLEKLSSIWEASRPMVQEVFAELGAYQLEIWRKLAARVEQTVAQQ